MIRPLFAVVGLALLTTAAVSMGGPPTTFIDIPSLVLVAGIVGIGTLLSFPPLQVLQALSPDSDATASSAVFHRMADLSVSAGIFGVIIGLIQMLRYMDDPSHIGPAMAVCLLTLFYGVGLGEFVFRGLATAQTPLPAASLPSRRGSISVYLPLTAVLLLLTMLGLIVAVLFVA